MLFTTQAQLTLLQIKPKHFGLKIKETQLLLLKYKTNTVFKSIPIITVFSNQVEFINVYKTTKIASYKSCIFMRRSCYC